MPTYEYECSGCGQDFELFQKMTDAPIEKCPQCGGKATRKISAGAGLLFKGSGFYITDYRSEGYKKAAQAETAGSGSGEGKSAKGSGGEGAAGKTSGEMSGGKSGASSGKAGSEGKVGGAGGSGSSSAGTKPAD